MSEQHVEQMTEKQESYLTALLSSRVCPAAVQGEYDFLKALDVRADKATATRWITALQTSPYKAIQYGAQAPAIHTTMNVSPAFPDAKLAAGLAPATPAVDTVSNTVHGYTAAVSHYPGKPAAKSTYEIFQEMELGFYTVTGGEATHHNYGDSDTAVYLVSIKKNKYGSGHKIVKRLYRDYANRPKWMAMGTSAAVNAIGGMAPVDINKVAALGLSWGFCLVCSRHLTDPFSVANGIGPVCAKRYGYKPAVQLAN